MTPPAPYYDADGITIYHGDAREILPHLPRFDLLCTDPPYGVNYSSGWDNALPGIAGDNDTAARDKILEMHDGPALVFGSWKRAKPRGTHTCLVWEKGDNAGMGDLTVPWKPNWEEIYVIGKGFSGKRTTGVLRIQAPVTWNSRGRLHAHEKPVALMQALLKKCPPRWVICDPFMGSGTTLVAAKNLGRRAIGIELEEKYCAIAVDRLRQGVLF